jgi:hypothetical protein
MTDKWEYEIAGPQSGDSRKLVTLSELGMIWVGIRIYNQKLKRWENNGEPETVHVIAWRDLPQPAQRYWMNGKLIGPELT